MVGVECLVYNEGRVLFTKLYSTARRRHGWVDIRMTDDALVDRNRVGVKQGLNGQVLKKRPALSPQRGF
jgi:hypothetical protein